MPLDASDRIRKIQQLALFNGFVRTEASLRPNINVSTCSGFYASTAIHSYDSYTTKIDLEQGLKYYSTCTTRS